MLDGLFALICWTQSMNYKTGIINKYSNAIMIEKMDGNIFKLWGMISLKF